MFWDKTIVQLASILEEPVACLQDTSSVLSTHHTGRYHIPKDYKLGIRLTVHANISIF